MIDAAHMPVSSEISALYRSTGSCARSATAYRRVDSLDDLLRQIEIDRVPRAGEGEPRSSHIG